MKSKDQILLEKIYTNLLKEQEDEHLESGYESRSDLDIQDDENVDADPFADDKEFDRQKDETGEEDDSEENAEEELDTPVEKKADEILSQGPPDDGISDDELKTIEDLIDQKGQKG